MSAEQIVATLLIASCVPFGMWTRWYDRKWGLK